MTKKLLKKVFILGLVLTSSVFVFPLGSIAGISDSVQFHLFGDAGMVYNSLLNTTFFQINELDLFAAGDIDKQVSYLTEICLQPSPGGVSLDIERTYAQYRISPWVKIGLGRFHTGIGYWNDTYHHGRYFYTAANRPQFLQFEDAGGLIPSHSTGVLVRGSGDVANGTIGYIAEVGNGRGPVKDPPSYFFNYNHNSLAFNASGYYQWDTGLRVGASVYYSGLPGGVQQNVDGSPFTAGPDMRPGATNTSSGSISGPSGTEWIAGLHLVYLNENWEWLNEYNAIIHNYDPGQVIYDGTPAMNTFIHVFYTQVAYTLGSLKPFLRFEIDDPNHVDAYLNAYVGGINPGLLGTTWRLTLGARYELSAASALKWENSYIASNALLEQQFGVGAAVLNVKQGFSSALNWSFAW